ncbi:hypothetical protein BECAL_01768 [Bellilinea caldifistulae]|uniref:Uncharacterized protein n=1 Tax=Bellilinea caldifistulae TaxID=360411 RepID=A0A0P6X6H1_9CHLR|nr:hypothetical protein [Bellilinea caldifistulae]KPL74960.1 hypothetical protein AC812_10620 [Bellilinea caldifistulae]GAP10595.1 hypothetical protein BECAL_01768 [Bellilinea caldifistulae]
MYLIRSIASPETAICITEEQLEEIRQMVKEVCRMLKRAKLPITDVQMPFDNREYYNVPSIGLPEHNRNKLYRDWFCEISEKPSAGMEFRGVFLQYGIFTDDNKRIESVKVKPYVCAYHKENEQYKANYFELPEELLQTRRNGRKLQKNTAGDVVGTRNCRRVLDATRE